MHDHRRRVVTGFPPLLGAPQFLAGTKDTDSPGIGPLREAAASEADMIRLRTSNYPNHLVNNRIPYRNVRR
jgi:hypothetical protein